MIATPPFLVHASQVHVSFAALGDQILTPSELAAFIRTNVPQWRYSPDPASTDLPSLVDSGKVWALRSDSIQAVIHSVLQHKAAKKITLPFPYRTEHRYMVGQVSDLELVQSLDKTGYFSHFTAIHMNQLTDQIPKTIYFNVEQYTSGGGGKLTQESLHRAFKAKPRISSNVIEYNQVRIHRLNGGNTHQLGVTEIAVGHSATPVRVTDIERTLIDATVRPVYSGGIAVVAKAFEMAIDRVSVKRIVEYLKGIDYTYPYHQAIGFYLDRAGYKNPDSDLLRDFPMQFDFYLAHDIKSAEYNAKWKLFVPKGF